MKYRSKHGRPLRAYGLGFEITSTENRRQRNMRALYKAGLTRSFHLISSRRHLRWAKRYVSLMPGNSVTDMRVQGNICMGYALCRVRCQISTCHSENAQGLYSLEQEYERWKEGQVGSSHIEVSKGEGETSEGCFKEEEAPGSLSFVSRGRPLLYIFRCSRIVHIQKIPLLNSSH